MGRICRWGRMLRAAAMAVAVLCPLSAFAQGESPELRREFEILFQRLLESPSDRALNERFIQVALLLNDTDAAIGALERLIFYNQQDPDLNYRLGSLYLQIESYVAAQTFFEVALAAPTASPEVREQASRGIAAAQEGLEGPPITGFAQAGIRYQTNANAAPAEIANQTDASFLETPDWNSFALLALSHREPFEGGVWEADATFYYADQFEIHRLDLGFAQIEAGPRLNLGETGALSIRPYGLAEGVLLGQDPYQLAYGGGASIRAAAESASIEPYFEYRNREFFNSEDYPKATEQTGEFFTYAADASAGLGERAGLTARGGLNHNEANVEDRSYDEYFAEMSLRLDLALSEAAGASPLSITPFAGVSWTEYAAIDPDDPVPVLREDFRWRAGARAQLPVGETFGLGFQVQYTKNESNIDTFDYDNLQLTAGPTARF